MKRDIRPLFIFMAAQVVLLVLIAILTLNSRIDQTSVFALILVGSVVFLMTTLFIIAAAFAHLGLSDRRQPLGLPEGSIRAMIALILILVFIMFGTMLYQGADDAEAKTRLGQQLLTTIGTLVVAISGFYFGSSSTASATAAGSAAARAQQVSDLPVIAGIDPASGESGVQKLRVSISGTNFQSPVSARLTRNGDLLASKVVDQSSTGISLDVSLADATVGKWDLVVENTGGGRARMPSAFEVQQASTTPDTKTTPARGVNEEGEKG